jgi:hypothetical protein
MLMDGGEAAKRGEAIPRIEQLAVTEQNEADAIDRIHSRQRLWDKYEKICESSRSGEHKDS